MPDVDLSDPDRRSRQNRRTNSRCNLLRRCRASSVGGVGMNKLQIRFLMRVHGLTEAQAHAVAALIWGAAQ